MKNWIEPEEINVPEDFYDAIGGHPLVSELLIRKGFNLIEDAKAFLDPACFKPSPAYDLPDLIPAAERLEEAFQHNEPVCVWGDFDVDGQTSTALLVSAFREMGGNVTYYIPFRDRESHGLNMPALERIMAGNIKLLVTCDTGVTGHKEIDYAMSHGVDVIVTDHHDLPDILPSAFAVINPKRLDASHGLRELPGVGCAYKLVEELYRRQGRESETRKYLDLVALGIVADIAVQTGDTRYLLQKGLEVLRNTERPGLGVIIENSGLNRSRLSEEHIGFAIAPRLNALGRLSDANLGVELLITDNHERAVILAGMLEGLNLRRKVLCDQVMKAAMDQIERDRTLLDYSALVMSHQSWPTGIIGIVANRLADIYSRPVILLSTALKDIARGSARSVKGCNIYEAISAQKDLLTGFGGHTMAAGLSMNPENIPDFRHALSVTLDDMSDNRIDNLCLSSYLPLCELSTGLVDQLQRLAPFGPGNELPVFVARDVFIKGWSRMGKKNEHRVLMVDDGTGQDYRVTWWQGASASLPEGRFDLAYTVRSVNYQGIKELQIEWIDVRTGEQVISPVLIDVVDYRHEEDRTGLLSSLEPVKDIQVWSEADKAVSGKNRYELIASENLVIWTVPPGPEEVKAVLKTVKPSKIYLFGVNSVIDREDVFLKLLSGLVKYAIKHGKVKIPFLAAATNSREIAVKKGLEWLSRKGYINISMTDGDEIFICEGNGKTVNNTGDLLYELKKILEETEAYRKYFLRADKVQLLTIAFENDR
ncbi:MAG: single-stranded-DNA-specific exonuclease RecJ [Candidatus Eremiobacterota bacterium]